MPLKGIIEEMKKLNEALEKANKDVDDMRKKANEDFNRLIEKTNFKQDLNKVYTRKGRYDNK